MMIKSTIALAAGIVLSSCASAPPPRCEEPNARSIVKHLNPERFLGSALMNTVPYTVSAIAIQRENPDGFEQRLETMVDKVAGLRAPEMRKALEAAYSKADPQVLVVMCDAINEMDSAALMKANAQIEPILGPELMPVLQDAGVEVLSMLYEGNSEK